MQYCSLQHWTLLLSPVTSTAGYSFCFGSIPSFFRSYFSTDLQQHTGHLLTWGVPLSVSYHFAFSYCSWGSQGNTEVVCHSLLQWTTFCLKRQNDRILKEKLPRSVGAQYATGDQWTNNSRKNEGMETKQKQYPAVDVTGDRSKVRRCKE